MTEIEQLLWAMIYRDCVKSGFRQEYAIEHANDAVDNFRVANEQE